MFLSNKYIMNTEVSAGLKLAFFLMATRWRLHCMQEDAPVCRSAWLNDISLVNVSKCVYGLNANIRSLWNYRNSWTKINIKQAVFSLTSCYWVRPKSQWLFPSYIQSMLRLMGNLSDGGMLRSYLSMQWQKMTTCIVSSCFLYELAVSLTDPCSLSTFQHLQPALK